MREAGAASSGSGAERSTAGDGGAAAAAGAGEAGEERAGELVPLDAAAAAAAAMCEGRGGSGMEQGRGADAEACGRAQSSGVERKARMPGGKWAAGLPERVRQRRGVGQVLRVKSQVSEDESQMVICVARDSSKDSSSLPVCPQKLKAKQPAACAAGSGRSACAPGGGL